ncbi:MAG: hypothetical protein RR255_00420 [Bacilli bacterium]
MEYNVIIGSLILGVISGGCCGLLFANLYDNTNLFKKIRIVSITILIFSIICYFGLKSDMTTFNNGICPNCNIKYNALQHENSDTYYECPNCYLGVWY